MAEVPGAPDSTFPSAALGDPGRCCEIRRMGFAALYPSYEKLSEARGRAVRRVDAALRIHRAEVGVASL
ncbi:hypothetical protein PSm6_50710 [Pseudomonas solani]|uniref:Uncharacterized protein n=1 Tax=Pseudomonas solani TaxID=2731552 RepID=A0ABM7LGC7_9PSED|nr:hypothetical protein PSm6_50710 [Pseudomonas solani]